MNIPSKNSCFVHVVSARLFAVVFFAMTIQLAGCQNGTEQTDAEQTDAKQNATEQDESGLAGTGTATGSSEPETGDQESTSSAVTTSDSAGNNNGDPSIVRFATFNASLFRDTAGTLAEELEGGESEHAKKIAEVIQLARPDVLLVNEFDYDSNEVAAAAFIEKYLKVSQNGCDPLTYQHSYVCTVNTGCDSGIDLDGNGTAGQPNDSFGFGKHHGQYGMLVLSVFEIDSANIRTFQNFLWKEMPDRLEPTVPGTGEPFYSKEATDIFRLSSKNHMDVPIRISDDKTVHFLVSHPTPPVFDNEEDRNGCRNHDEIRMFADYVSGNADYLYDDKGIKGGLPAGSHFVIAGDLNADPNDGDSRDQAARLLTANDLVQTEPVPASEGGMKSTEKKGGRSAEHHGDPAHDTSNWSSGNYRVDYCLPSKTLTVKASGVFWPVDGEPGAEAVEVTDHRMVWIDIEK